jgi:hypothetical protein
LSLLKEWILSTEHQNILPFSQETATYSYPKRYEHRHNFTPPFLGSILMSPPLRSGAKVALRAMFKSSKSVHTIIASSLLENMHNRSEKV